MKEISYNLRRFGKINVGLEELDEAAREAGLSYDCIESRELSRRLLGVGRDILSFAENLRNMPKHYAELSKYLAERYAKIYEEAGSDFGVAGLFKELLRAA